jgi:uncharacterized protein (TIGR03083 family)
MTRTDSQVIERFRLASEEFRTRLRAVRPPEWTRPTPCSAWNVRDLVAHMTQGNLNYRMLAEGGTAADFLRLRASTAPSGDLPGADPPRADPPRADPPRADLTRADLTRADADLTRADPVAAFADSVTACAAAFAAPGALDRILDYPLGPVRGRQALAVRTADTVIHTWDLARAVGAPDCLAAGLVAWLASHLDEIYAGLPETPIDPASTHQFFAPPGDPVSHSPQQDLLLIRLGRDPSWRPRGTWLP